MSSDRTVNGHAEHGYRYCAFVDPSTNKSRIGDLDGDIIQPLAYASGTPLLSLYEVVQLDDAEIVPSSKPIPRNSVKLLAPISGRDILCVGKNYAEHAKEFNKSGFDSSDKTDQPTHPVIFTKRSTSIIADGEEILPHVDFTQTVDFEGELGVIIGKPGFRISEAQAMEHVWGYVIINDMTARERQRDHKQFYIGKSPDTFCPMGPVAIRASRLQKTLQVQTRINGVLRQNATTEDLIFSIPFLIKTMSEGQTLMSGDVLATGTPAGVGIGRNPPVYLNPGDEISVSITGLGTLTNRIASPSTTNTTIDKALRHAADAIPLTNSSRTLSDIDLQLVNGRPTHIVNTGSSNATPAVFVHGLGGTLDYWTPLIQTAELSDSHALHLYDFEGHGLSPTSPRQKLSIGSLAGDLKAFFDHLQIHSGATLIAHSMGCLIAMHFVLQNPGLVRKLVLMGPPPSPLPPTASTNTHARAELVRARGMDAVVDAVAAAGTSEHTQTSNPLAVAAVKLSLRGQDPEGYAKACGALAEATDALDVKKIDAQTLIVTGSEDKVSAPALCEKYAQVMAQSKQVVVLPGVGHWHVFEAVNEVAKNVRMFLQDDRR